MKPIGKSEPFTKIPESERLDEAVELLKESRRVITDLTRILCAESPPPIMLNVPNLITGFLKEIGKDT